MMSCNVAAAHLSNLYGLVTSFVDFFPRDVGGCFVAVFRERFSGWHGSGIFRRSRGRISRATLLSA